LLLLSAWNFADDAATAGWSSASKQHAQAIADDCLPVGTLRQRRRLRRRHTALGRRHPVSRRSRIRSGDVYVYVHVHVGGPGCVSGSLGLRDADLSDVRVEFWLLGLAGDVL